MEKTLRNTIVLTLAVAAFVMTPHAKADTRPLVGALRWDGYYGVKADEVASPGNDPIGAGAVKTLSPLTWHYRLPFFGTVVSNTQIQLPGYTQAVVDQEIAYAKNAGIDYWIFDRYDDAAHLSDALHTYLASSHANDVKFTFMLNPGNLGLLNDTSSGLYNFTANEKHYFALMKQPNFQTVLGNRPLIYIGFIDDSWMTTYWGNTGGFKGMISKFKSDATAAGLANPYIVIMDFSPQKASQYVTSAGADAITSYAVSNASGSQPYSNLVSFTEEYWNNSKATGASVIPIVMTGWDNRPFAQTPASWYPGPSATNYYQEATPAQIAAHLLDSFNWVKNNPTVDPANTVIMYAWDENLEGGWLVPTLGDGTARLDAIKTVTYPDHLPVGTLDSISSSGVVNGWVADQDNPNAYAAIYIDGPYTTGTALGYGIGNISRPDVLAAIGYGAHSGFKYQIPMQYLTDGKTHKIYAYGIDAATNGVPLTGGTNPLLAQSGMTVPPYAKPGDLNGDGKVDVFDYNLLVQNFGHPYTIFDYNQVVANFGK